LSIVGLEEKKKKKKVSGKKQGTSVLLRSGSGGLKREGQGCPSEPGRIKTDEEAFGKRGKLGVVGPHRGGEIKGQKTDSEKTALMPKCEGWGEPELSSRNKRG